jgi:hypothetical protein
MGGQRPGRIRPLTPAEVRSLYRVVGPVIGPVPAGMIMR